MKVEIDEGLVLSLPAEGEQYGTDNLEVVARFAGRIAGKITKWGRDGKFQFNEKIAAVFTAGRLAKEGRKLVWEQIMLEYTNLSHDERVKLESIAEEEFLQVSAYDGPARMEGWQIIHHILGICQRVTDFAALWRKEEVA